MASVVIDKGVDVISVVGNGDARRRVSCVGGCGGGGGGGGEAAAGSVISCPSSSSSSQQRTSSGSPTTKDVLAMAQRVATKPLPISRSDLWGLLTAVSDRARKRPQVWVRACVSHFLLLLATLYNPCEFVFCLFFFLFLEFWVWKKSPLPCRCCRMYRMLVYASRDGVDGSLQKNKLQLDSIPWAVCCTSGKFSRYQIWNLGAN